MENIITGTIITHCFKETLRLKFCSLFGIINPLKTNNRLL